MVTRPSLGLNIPHTSKIASKRSTRYWYRPSPAGPPQAKEPAYLESKDSWFARLHIVHTLALNCTAIGKVSPVEDWVNTLNMTGINEMTAWNYERECTQADVSAMNGRNQNPQRQMSPWKTIMQITVPKAFKTTAIIPKRPPTLKTTWKSGAELIMLKTSYVSDLLWTRKYISL